MGRHNRVPGRPKMSGMLSWVALILFFLLSGVLLVFFPKYAFPITAAAIGVFLCLVGIKNVVVFFKTSVEQTLRSLELTSGLMEIFFGVLFLAAPDSFDTLLRYAWAISILMGAFSKIQLGITTLRLKGKDWWLYFIFAAVSLVLGFIAFFRLDSFVGKTGELETPSVTLGIFLWVEAVMDAFCVIRNYLKIKKYMEVPGPAGAVPPSPPAPPAPPAQ